MATEMRNDVERVMTNLDFDEMSDLPKLQVPSIEQLMQWEWDGGCEAACEYGCWVESDGYCEHGKPSWLLKLGMI